MSNNLISHLPHWQTARVTVLLDALDGVVISDAERGSLAWSAGFEAHIVENIDVVIARARMAAPRV